jgi:hypothetical protein
MSSTPENLRGVERFADHAGRGEENIAFAATDGLGGSFRRLPGRFTALAAGKGISVAGIHDDRAGDAARQVARGRNRPGPRGICERVKTPATVAGRSKIIISTSVRFLYLIPAAAVAMRTPWTTGIVG